MPVTRQLPRLVRVLLIALATASAPGTHAVAQTPPATWDVTLARGKTRQVDFVTREGTWMTVDLSPDGQWIYFDLLGHIYRMPASGGTATSLTQSSGVALNYQPAVSPDGRTIAFISDRKGQNNLWIMDADGGNPRQVESDLNARTNDPVWTPDGQFILVERRTLPGGAGGSGIFMFHRNGGKGVAVVDGQQARGAAWPSPSADGRYLYFQENTPGETVSWTHGEDADEPAVDDILQGSVQLRRLELRTGRIEPITGGPPTRQFRISSGGAYAAEISPDGKWLAFARRIPDGTFSYKGHRFGPRTALWLLDLETGRERILMDPIELDMTEAIKVLRILPGYRWAADGRSLVIAQGGKIRRVDVATGAVTTIPFEARVQRTISEQAYRPFRIDDGSFETKFHRWQTASPDGRLLAFEATGRIWLGERAGGTPRRLTTGGESTLEYAPAWSPDGQWVAFVTVNDRAEGQLWKAPAGGGAAVQLTTEPGEYLHPVWTPDGQNVVVTRGAGASINHWSLTHSPYYDIGSVPAAGGRFRTITRAPMPEGSFFSFFREQTPRPSVSDDGRVWFPDLQLNGTGVRWVLVSVAPDGSDRREVLSFPYADEIVVSGDGRRAAFNEGDNVYWVPIPPLGTATKPIAIEKKNGSLPITTVSTTGGLYPRWRGSVLEFGSGNRYFRHDPVTARTDTTTVRHTVTRAIPKGRVALTNARLITLDNRRVIERGTIVVDGARISCVGRCSTTGARIIDAGGKTIMPGWVDMHSHFFREYRGVFPKHMFETGVALAHGVTTNLDNSMWSQDVFPVAEMIEAGEVIGPRTFSTGDPLYLGDGSRQNELSSYQVTEDNIARLQSWGAVSLKQYMQPRRDQRQWVSDVARKRGLMVTAEGADLPYNLSMIMDGQTGWEHPMSYAPIYGDVSTFFGQANAFYSPTAVVGGAGPWNDEYFFGESEVWKDPKLRLWMPWRQLVPHARRRMLRPATDYSYPLLAQSVADLIAAGGHGAIGAHGQQHGIASHWEVWMYATALGPHGALEMASMGGATMLGAQQDIGSLTVGKLADLVVLDRNPLANIRNTASIRWVMKGGTLYDGTTLDEIWPTARAYGARPWIDEASLRTDVRATDHHDRPPGGR
ncbi:MAG: PD40 domain-containing protein [Gemmatimonadetes bacterium]|nr:PD40 domain-containing protein [Gemmatimonadota bacterium]